MRHPKILEARNDLQSIPLAMQSIDLGEINDHFHEQRLKLKFGRMNEKVEFHLTQSHSSYYTLSYDPSLYTKLGAIQHKNLLSPGYRYEVNLQCSSKA